jgi:hypothetical protein
MPHAIPIGDDFFFSFFSFFFVFVIKKGKTGSLFRLSNPPLPPTPRPPFSHRPNQKKRGEGRGGLKTLSPVLSIFTFVQNKAEVWLSLFLGTFKIS